MGMSRNEDILQAIIDGGDSSEFLPARSREEFLLIQILDIISSGGSGGGSGLSIHICSSDEYDPYTMVPTVSNPSGTTFYLVPTPDIGNNLYDEWIYINGFWERFGSGGIIVPYLTSLGDIDISYPSNGQALVYDSNKQKWTNNSSIPCSASIDENGLISWKNEIGMTLFTLQLPS